MSSPFDPSPRETKRRRTARYTKQRTTLVDTNSSVAADPNQPHEAIEPLAAGEQRIAREVNATATNPPSTTKRPSSRRKANVTDNVDAHIPEEDEVIVEPGIPSTKRKGRQRKSDVRAAQQEAEDEVEEEQAAQPTIQDDEAQNGEDEGPEIAETPQPRSSGRNRRPPKRLEETAAKSLQASTKRTKTVATAIPVIDDVLSPTPASPALKGILTPSRKQKQHGQSRKSVMFDQDEKEIEEQFGFRDVGTPATAKKLPKRGTPYPKKTAKEQDVPTMDENGVDHEIDMVQPAEDDLDDLLVDVVEDELQATIPELSKDSTNFSTADRSTDPPQLQQIKQAVLSRLTSSIIPSTAPQHFEQQYTTLHTLLKATVANSESNSLLLLGPRGAGKSLLLDIALQDLTSQYHNAFHIVRLNGFIQTDDRLALREIWRQLGHERDVDAEEVEDVGSSYADTMASLLSLLSHPDEMIPLDTYTDGEQAVQRTSKSIVFILNEFDLFTTHPRQTLLYNLFDIAQSRKAPIAVMGCSSRMDVIECLEKRVKSRFSHRWLFVGGCGNIREWEAEVKKSLVMVGEAVVRLEKDKGGWVERWNQWVEGVLLPSKEIQTLIKSHFYTTKSLPDLFMALYPLVATAQLPDASSSSAKKISTVQARASALSAPPSILSVLTTLPVLHLSLLVSMCRLETIHILTASNFNLVHTHYRELIQTSRLKQSAHGAVAHSGTLRQWGRETCRGAWEELGLWGVIVPVVGGAREDESAFGGGGAEAEETRMWKSELTLEDVLWGIKQKFEGDGSVGGGGAGEVLTRWCKEI